jgi:arginase
MLGVPTSAAAHWPGLEKGPAALRGAGLAGGLRSAGLEVVDYGDRPVSRWAANRSGQQPNNLRAAVEVLRDARHAGAGRPG